MGPPPSPGTGRRDGYRGGELVSYASWSPDGSEIAVAYETPNGAPSVYLAVIAPDGSDTRLLVIKEENGDLTAARPGNKRCLLWICW